MYSLEDRMRAVQLYIKSGCNEGTVIRELGYPSPTALRNWYKGTLLRVSSTQPVLQSLITQSRRRSLQSITSKQIKHLCRRPAVHWVTLVGMFCENGSLKENQSF